MGTRLEASILCHVFNTATWCVGVKFNAAHALNCHSKFSKIEKYKSQLKSSFQISGNRNNDSHENQKSKSKI